MEVRALKITGGRSSKKTESPRLQVKNVQGRGPKTLATIRNKIRKQQWDQI